MAGFGEVFDRPRVAGAEDDGFRARSTSAVPRSGTFHQSGCRARTTPGRCLSRFQLKKFHFLMGRVPRVVVE